jgi:hypothetical protein
LLVYASGVSSAAGARMKKKKSKGSENQDGATTPQKRRPTSQPHWTKAPIKEEK